MDNNGFSPEMQRALRQDAQKLRGLGQPCEEPVFLDDDPVPTYSPVVPPPAWGEPYPKGIVASCGCEVWHRFGGHMVGYPCPTHNFAALDSGLALLRGALAQQEEKP